MRIYIANLGKYNEGELVGAWFTPPVDFEEVKERISLNDEYTGQPVFHSGQAAVAPAAIRQLGYGKYWG